MAVRIAIETADGTTIVGTNDVPDTTVQVLTTSVPTYLRGTRDLTASASAVKADALKVVRINTASGNVTYSILPALLNGYTLEIKCVDGTNTATVAALSGTIKLNTEPSQTSVTLLAGETIRLFSDGTNLEQL